MLDFMKMFRGQTAPQRRQAAVSEEEHRIDCERHAKALQIMVERRQALEATLRMQETLDRIRTQQQERGE